MADGFADITDDHREVERLLEEYDRNGDHGAARAACELLALHAAAEETALYPHLRSLGSGESTDEGVTDGVALNERAELEHADLAAHTARVLAAPPADLREPMHRITELVRQHVAFEERELLPRLRPIVDAEELHRAFGAAKREVTTRAGQPMF